MPGHCTSDMYLVPLELLPTKSTSRRKAREAYLIDRGKTLEHGLNRFVISLDHYMKASLSLLL